MADVQFVTPSSPFDPAAELNIKRRRKMADAMMKAGEQPQSTEMVSGMAVKQSPMAALARALTQGVAGYQEGQADKEDATVQTNRQKMMADAINKVGTDPNGAAASLAQDPTTAPYGMQISLENMKDQKAMKLAQFKAAHGGEGGTVASALQLANEYQKARAAGDMNRMNDLTMFSKSLEKGQTLDPAGQVTNMGGFVPAAAQVVGAKQDAKNTSDLSFKPRIANQVADQTEVGKANGVATAAFEDQTAQLPRLEQVVTQLSDLGKKATYTTTGRVVNAGKRELGLPVGEGAVARKDYISKVDNEILPLLRQTFGAQFTEKEGQTLRNTLGDVNASPEEKDAVLRGFIDQKRAQIQTLQRRTGQAPAIPNQTPAAPAVDYKSKYGLQ